MEAKAKDSKDEAEGTTTRQNERKLASPEVPRSLSNTSAHRGFSNAENVVSATTKSSSDQFSNPYEIKSRHPGTGTVFGDTTGPSNIFEGTASGSTTQNNIMAASTHGKRKMDVSSGSSKLQRISLDDDISIRESSHVESGQELRKNPEADISYINTSNGLAAAFDLEAQENMQVPDADAVAVDDDHLEKKTDVGTDKVADMNGENDVNKKVTKISKPTLRKTRKAAALSVEQETDTIADNKKRKPTSSRSVQARIFEVQKKMQIATAAADDDVTEMDANKETKKNKRPLSKTKKDPALSVKEVTETKSVKKKGKTTSSRSVKALDMEAQKENMEIPEDDRSTGNKQVLKSATEGSEKVTCKSDKADSEPKWFILTGNSLQRKEFQQLIQRLKGGVCNVSHQWSYQATHLIVPDPIERTAKLFAAAASGRWILKTDYLTASNQAGKFLAEEPYELHENGLSDDEKIDLEAPRKWRLLKEKTGYGAFHGMRIVIYGECTAPSLDTLERAVKAGDGTILATSPPYTRFLDNGIDFAVVSPGVPSVNIWVQWFLRSEIPCISADYLVEYVCKPGYPLDGHVRYGTNDWAERSYNNLKKRLDEEDNTGPRTRDSYDVACEVCGLHDRC
ncbi:BRCT domain-containing protein [Artemisia annua]|nr:BRCT domain-containing protein [Artemisia annua]